MRSDEEIQEIKDQQQQQQQLMMAKEAASIESFAAQSEAAQKNSQ